MAERDLLWWSKGQMGNFHFYTSLKNRTLACRVNHHHHRVRNNNQQWFALQEGNLWRGLNASTAELLNINNINININNIQQIWTKHEQTVTTIMKMVIELWWCWLKRRLVLIGSQLKMKTNIKLFKFVSILQKDTEFFGETAWPTSKLCETQIFRLWVDRWKIGFGGKCLVENCCGNFGGKCHI